MNDTVGLIAEYLLHGRLAGNWGDTFERCNDPACTGQLADRFILVAPGRVELHRYCTVCGPGRGSHRHDLAVAS